MPYLTTIPYRTKFWKLLAVAGVDDIDCHRHAVHRPPQSLCEAADDADKAKGRWKTERKPRCSREGEVGRNEELGFLQAKVSSQMTELEERMFRLSDALKSMEPENASRLLIGLKYAREELIQLQMKEIQSALSDKKYNDALVEQKELLAKLRRLEQLLLSPDLDFQLQLERLRLMRDLMRRLDAAIQEEEREKTASDQSADSEEKLKEMQTQSGLSGGTDSAADGTQSRPDMKCLAIRRPNQTTIPLRPTH